MNEQNIDLNLVIQSFQEKVTQLVTEVVVKEATIKQLTAALIKAQSSNEEFQIPTESIKKEK